MTELYSKIVDIALSRDGRSWQKVPAELTAVLTGEVRDRLSVDTVGKTGAIALIEEVGPRHFGGDSFTAAERVQLLIDLDDVKLLRQMPIHENREGVFRAISEQSYWEADYPVEPCVEDEVQILKKSGDARARAQQERLVQDLTAELTLEIIIRTESPERHWEAILRAFNAVDKLDDSLAQTLAEKSWLPLRNGAYVAPLDVLHIFRLEDEIARVLAVSDTKHVARGELHDKIFEFTSLSKLTRLFPDRNDALDSLGRIMSEQEVFSIGEAPIALRGLPDEAWLLKMIACLREASPEVMPAVSLLAKLNEAGVPPAVWNAKLVSKIARPISTDRLILVLNHLTDLHDGSTREQKPSVASLFNFYLKEIVNAGCTSNTFPRIRLLNRRGRWKDPGILCHIEMATSGTSETLGLDPEDLLDLGQSSVIYAHRPTESNFDRTSQQQLTEQLPPAENISQAADLLEKYFQDWEGFVPREIIGGFLSILGDDEGIRDLATRYLGNRTLDTTRDAIGLEELITEQRVVVTVIGAEASSITVQSVLGTPFQAAIRDHGQHLFLAYTPTVFPCQRVKGDRICWIRLRYIDPERLTTEQLSELLRQSAAMVLSEVYGETKTNLDEVWEDLCKSEQLDIRIAQRLLLEAAPFYLRQLGLAKTEHLGDALRNWDSARRGSVEADEKTEPNSVARKRAGESLREAHRELLVLLKSDKATHEAVIGAIRAKVSKHYQYKRSSVPFELFQNADDAYRELELLEPEGIALMQEPSFVCTWDERFVRFLHFGRRINEYVRGSICLREDGFDRDLEKMLVLSSSDKSTESCDVTGKFGLGFKSVFLVADKPVIISGRLAFWVACGVLPIPLKGQKFERRAEYLKYGSEDPRTATLIELRLNHASVDEVIPEFRRLAHVLVAFALRIRHIHLRDGEQTDTASWREKQLVDIPHLFTGNLCAVGEHVNRGLLFRSESGAFLFQLGPQGLVPFKDDVPSIWVTAPTTEQIRVGFALNSRFALDIGRAKLASQSVDNLEKAAKIANDFGAALAELYKVCGSDEGWSQVKTDCNLAQDCTRYEFWYSVWRLLAEEFAEAAGDGNEDSQILLRAALWSPSPSGLPGFYSSTASLPTGLPGDQHRQLVRIEDLAYCTSGQIDVDEELFFAICDWREFERHIGAGRLASQSRILNRLVKLAPDLIPSGIEKVTIASAVAWELDAHGSVVDSELANQIGKVITPELLVSLESGSYSDQAEARNIYAFLEGAYFIARDGNAYLAKDLLLSGDEGASEDEGLRVRFAPESAVLGDQYDRNAWRFFLICRRRLEAPASRLAEWALRAADEEAQYAVLRYFLQGDLRQEVAQSIQTHDLDGTWLNSQVLAGTAAFGRLTPTQQKFILALLLLHSVQPEDDEEEEKPSRDPTQILAEIYDWWINHVRDHETRRYEERIYPDGRKPVIDGEGTFSNPQFRQEWVLLFLAGIVHTMGRTQPEAHRAFLSMCRQSGWLSIFADPDATPQQWLSIIDGYFESLVDESRFLHWMRQYVGIRAISRRLDDYIEAFMAIDRFQEPFVLDQITRTRTSASFQGGGIDAPPVERVLGMGACFVVRELVRGGVISNPNAHPHCFVPAKRVRKLISTIGLKDIDVETGSNPNTSRKIYQFIHEHLGTEKVTFGGSFDLPLLVIAEDRELQERFLGRTLETDEGDSGGW